MCYEFDVFDERGNGRGDSYTGIYWRGIGYGFYSGFGDFGDGYGDGSEGVLHRWRIDDDGGRHFSEGNMTLVGAVT